jgi:GR25 family glycosyltransferase involved in LPS biosynthesis
MKKVHLHIIHAKYLANRAPLFQGLISKLGDAKMLARVSMHSNKDPNEIVGEDVSLFTNQNLPDGDKFAYFNTIMKQLTPPQVSNCLKHLDAIAQIASGDDPDDMTHLIVEDDVLFSDHVAAQLEAALAEFDKLEKRKILFLGVPSPPAQTPTIRDATEFYKIIPSCDSFLIDKAAADTILKENVLPPNRIRFVNNVQLTLALLRSEIPIKLFAPHIFVDGSKFGAVNSNLENNNRLLLNPNYNRIVQLVDALPKDGSAKRQPEIDELLSRFDFKNSPELYFLKAKYETRLGNYHYAKAVFEFAYNMQVNMGVPLSQGSDFMREYMKIFKHHQP